MHVNLDILSGTSGNEDPRRIPTLKFLPPSLNRKIQSLFVFQIFVYSDRSSRRPEEKKEDEDEDGDEDGDEDSGRAEMEECMRECMRKLALWFTRTFKPIVTHDELAPIMDTLGFVALPHAGSPAWKEYAYVARGSRYLSPSAHTPPRPRLPYPRIDGLHICTYRAFIDSVNYYLEMSNISDLFHIRGMPLHRVYDKNKKWKRMEEEESVFVYRDGTLEQGTYNLYNVRNCPSPITTKYKVIIRNEGDTNVSLSPIVRLNDIIFS